MGCYESKFGKGKQLRHESAIPTDFKQTKTHLDIDPSTFETSKPYNVEVIEPSVRNTQLINALEINGSLPAEFFANMNDLDDCFKNSQVIQKA